MAVLAGRFSAFPTPPRSITIINGVDVTFSGPYDIAGAHELTPTAGPATCSSAISGLNDATIHTETNDAGSGRRDFREGHCRGRGRESVEHHLFGGETGRDGHGGLDLRPVKR